jgi:hypothetical protein
MQIKQCLQALLSFRLAIGLIVCFSFPVHANNLNRLFPTSVQQSEHTQENKQISYYLKYKTDMQEKAESLVRKLGGTITDVMPERRILIVVLDKAVFEEIDSDRIDYSDIVDYVEPNPERQLFEKKTGLSL